MSIKVNKLRIKPKPNLKIDTLDFELLKLAYQALQNAKTVHDGAQSVVGGHLRRLAAARGITVEDYSFNLDTQGFELKPKEPHEK